MKGFSQRDTNNNMGLTAPRFSVMQLLWVSDPIGDCSRQHSSASSGKISQDSSTTWFPQAKVYQGWRDTNMKKHERKNMKEKSCKDMKYKGFKQKHDERLQWCCYLGTCVTAFLICIVDAVEGSFPVLYPHRDRFLWKPGLLAFCEDTIWTPKSELTAASRFLSTLPPQ